jgi:hypothetical protein
MIQCEDFILERDKRENDEHDKGDDLLDHLKLNEGEGAAILIVADAVGRNL